MLKPEIRKTPLGSAQQNPLVLRSGTVEVTPLQYISGEWYCTGIANDLFPEVEKHGTKYELWMDRLPRSVIS